MNADQFFEKLDVAALDLLERCKKENIETGDDGEITVTVAEHVKAFQAVMDYAALRAKLEPPKKAEGSKFDELRTRFHGNGSAPGRRTGRKNGASEASGVEGGPQA